MLLKEELRGCTNHKCEEEYVVGRKPVVEIHPGVNSHSEGNIFPTVYLLVTVTAEAANGGIFTTDTS